MITSVIELLELPSVGDVIDKSCAARNLFENTFILRRPRVSIFADIIKVVTMFVKAIFSNSKEIRRIKNYVSKCNLYLYFLIQQNLSISGKKMLMSADLKGCLTSFICFLDLLQVRCNYAKSYHCGIYVADFREGELCASLPSVSSPKKAHQIDLKTVAHNTV